MGSRAGLERRSSRKAEKLLEAYAKNGELSSEQVYAQIFDILGITLELASSSRKPNDPIIVAYDEKRRTVSFLPRAEPMDINALKQKYNLQELALTAA